MKIDGFTIEPYTVDENDSVDGVETECVKITCYGDTLIVPERSAGNLARVLQHFADHGTLPTPTPKGE